METDNLNIQGFIQNLPKAELYLHLEGAIPWDMVCAQSDEALPETPLWWGKDFRFDDFDDFVQEIRFCRQNVLTSIEAYYQIASRIFQTLIAQNVAYVEISFGLEAAFELSDSLEPIVQAIKSAAPASLTVRVYAGIARHHHPETLEASRLFSCPNLDGIDLHGDERLGRASDYAEIFAQAQALGLLTKAHAGEIVGPESISEALDHLAVKRLEHGTTAVYDDALVQRLAQENITLDLCPSSNLKLGVINHIQAHPIKYFYEQGIPVTVNTDDPTLFGCSLNGELYLLYQRLGFQAKDLAQLQANAFQVADMPETLRQSLLKRLEHLVDQFYRQPMSYQKA